MVRRYATRKPLMSFLRDLQRRFHSAEELMISFFERSDHLMVPLDGLMVSVEWCITAVQVLRLRPARSDSQS